MAFCNRRAAVLLSLAVSGAFAQQPKQPAAPIVQPGAPGKSTKKVSTAAVKSAPKRTPAEADVYFMQGMIHHHAQAVEMVDLLRTHGASKALHDLGERMTVSQSDEINYMKQWLTERGKPTMMPHNHAAMAGGGMAMPLMPGMLTPEQMAALAKARSSEFDKLFLTGMIQHHTGALIMVEDLFDVPGAGQDAALFDFATDIDNTQRAEIEIMRGMLKEIK